MGLLNISAGNEKPSRPCTIASISIFGEQELVGGLEHVYAFLIFPYIVNVIIPIDELTFFRGVETQPPTSYPQIIHRLSIDYP